MVCPRTVSARACLLAGLTERSCALPPPDCRVYPGFTRLAIAAVAATCPRCHDCCGLLACRALETLLARGPVSDWDDLSATDARTVGSPAWSRSATKPRARPGAAFRLSSVASRGPDVLGSQCAVDPAAEDSARFPPLQSVLDSESARDQSPDDSKGLPPIHVETEAESCPCEDPSLCRQAKLIHSA